MTTAVTATKRKYQLTSDERTLHHSDLNHSDKRRMGVTSRVTVPFVKVYQKQPLILVSGSDRMGFNQLADPPRG